CEIRILGHRFADGPKNIEMMFRNEQFFFPGSGTADVDGRENSPFRQRTIQMKFHIARSFKFLVNHVVHPRTGINERRCQNRQAAAFFNIAGRSEEPFRTVECRRVNSPDSVRPLGGMTRLYARDRRVILSIKMTTSRLCTTSLIARSRTSSATLMWFSGTSSNVELTTSACTERSMSVTSSGRSSISKIMSSVSGWFFVMALAICFNSIVFPAFGGEIG